MAEKKSAKEAGKKPAPKATEKQTKKETVEKKLVKAEKNEKPKKVEEKTEKAVKVEEKEKKTEKKKKNPLLFIGIALSVIVIGLLIYFFIIKKPSDTADPKSKLSYSNSFFISDDGKYTLWNRYGARVTQDEYDGKSDFVAGCASVQKEGQSAIVRENGTLAVDYGRYGEITARGGVYLAKDGNTKLYSVITCDGKILMQGQDLKITSYGNNGFALIESEASFDLFTWSGKRLTSLAKAEGVSEPVLDGAEDFGTLYYNGQNFIFDARKSQIIAAFEGAQYEIDDISEDRSQVLLEGDDENIQVRHKIIRNGVLYDLTDTDNYGFVNNSYLIGYNDFDAVALLDNNYKLVKYVGTYLALKDINNYAVLNDEDEENPKAEIVVNNNVVATFDKEPYVASGVLRDDFYVIRNDGKFRFYNLNGTPAFDGKEYAAVWGVFDEYHHVPVADAEDEYYLIDTQGKRLHDGTFKRIYQEKGGYELKSSDDKYGIMTRDGTIASEAKYTSVYYRSSAIDHDIWTGRNSYNDYDVYDLTAGKIILQNANVQSFYAHYFTVTNSDKKTEYYTYDGTLFYTTK